MTFVRGIWDISFRVNKMRRKFWFFVSFGHEASRGYFCGIRGFLRLEN